MKDISRRSFIFGGGAAALGAGLALSGCGLKSSDLDMTNAKAEIIGGMAYSSNDFNISCETSEESGKVFLYSSNSSGVKFFFSPNTLQGVELTCRNIRQHHIQQDYLSL